MKNINKIFYILGFCMFLLILLDLIFIDQNIYYMAQAKCVYQNGTILFFIICSIAIILKCKKKFLNKVKGIKFKISYKYILIASSIILLAIQLCISWNIYFHTGWDCSKLVNTANNIVFNGTNIHNDIYYTRYPNNIVLTYIFTFLISTAKVLKLNDPYFMLVIGSNILVNLTGVFTVLIVHKLTKSKKWTILSWMIYIGLIGLSPWITVPYSDTYSIIIPVAAFYTYISIDRNKKRDLYKWAIIGMLSFIGFNIKPQVVIILIAIFIEEIIRDLFTNKETRILLVAKIAIILLCFSIVKVGVSEIGISMGYAENKNVQFTSWHFLMMGLNKERSGVFIEGDYQYSESFKTKETREAANKKEIKQRIKNYGVKGLAIHTAKKTLVNFNDGTFAWGIEGGFYEEVLKSKNNIISNGLRSIYYNKDGSNKYSYACFRLFVQALWILVLIGCLGAICCRNRDGDENNYLAIIILSLIGITLFETLFEARARYLYCFSPIFLVCSIMGMRNLLINIRK